MTEKYAVILFHSTNHAVWASDSLKGAGVESKMIPVPRELSSDCGYCVRINRDDSDKAKVILEGEEVEFAKITNFP